MSIVITELSASRARTGKDRTRKYKIAGAVDEQDAFTAMIAFVPATMDGLPLDVDSCSVDEFEAGSLFVGTAKYASANGDLSKQQVGSFSVSFEIGSQSVTLKYAYGTVSYTADGESAEDYDGAINVEKFDGTPVVNGLEIQVPVFSFTVTYTVDPDLITDDYIAILRSVVGKVNEDQFKLFEPGECLLTRVTGQRRDADNWDVSFTFGVIENDDDYTVGGIN